MDFLEELKVRVTEAQRRVQTTQHALAVAQGVHQAAVQEFSSLQFLIQTETAKRQQERTLNASEQPLQQQPAVATPAPQPPEVNKTDLVREILRQHPTGMAPTEIWKEVKSQMSHRAYLYSILGRLKDRDEVIVRRKKYFLRVVPKPAEEKEQAIVH